MIVRKATEKDVPDIVRLGSQMHGESVYKKYPYDEIKFATNLLFWLDNPERFLISVVEDSNGVFGGQGGFLSELMFCSELNAYDMFLFVDPSRRGGMSAIKLIRAFEEWAISMGAVEICPGTTTMVAPERTSKLYERLGYTVVGSIFKKGG